MTGATPVLRCCYCFMAMEARSWDVAARALSAEWHVIAPDWRGHGDSQWSPDGAYSTPYFVMELADLIDLLAE